MFVNFFLKVVFRTTPVLFLMIPANAYGTTLRLTSSTQANAFQRDYQFTVEDSDWLQGEVKSKTDDFFLEFRAEENNYLQRLIGALRGIKADGNSESLEAETTVTTLPRVRASQILQGVYDFSEEERQRQAANQTKENNSPELPRYKTNAPDFEPKDPISLIQKRTRNNKIDPFSSELSRFGDPTVETGYASSPRTEHFLSVRGSYGNAARIRSLPGEFGTASARYDLPAMPSGNNRRQKFRKYRTQPRNY